MTKQKYKVRFNLGAGKHYRQWQVRVGKETQYYDPDQFCIMMKWCKLKNRPAIAKKIHSGASRTVCAWIECEELWVCRRSPASDELVKELASQITYNPRVAPNWVESDRNVDGNSYGFLHTLQRGVYRPLR